MLHTLFTYCGLCSQSTAPISRRPTSGACVWWGRHGPRPIASLAAWSVRVGPRPPSSTVFRAVAR